MTQSERFILFPPTKNSLGYHIIFWHRGQGLKSYFISRSQIFPFRRGAILLQQGGDGIKVLAGGGIYMLKLGKPA